MEELCRFRPPQLSRQLTWEITRFCNLLCDHCCTMSGPDAARSHEPTTEALILAAGDLAASGITKVQFSGGEPLLRDGFLEVLDTVDTDVVSVHLASNGYSLTDRVIERLVTAGLHKLSVSVDGGTAEHHDLIRRKSGAFDRTMDGVSRSVSAGLCVGISATVTPGNISSLEALVNRLAEIGVADVSFHSVVAVGRAVHHPDLLFAADRERELEDELRRLHEIYGQDVVFDHSFGGDASRSTSGCPAQDRLLHIDPSGDVSPCSWLYKLDPVSFTLGNITAEPLREIVDRHCERLEDLRSQETERCIIPLATLAPIS